jgi:hypothetical protein
MSHPRKRGIYGQQSPAFHDFRESFMGCCGVQSRRMMSAELLSIRRRTAPRFFAASQGTVVFIDRCARPVHGLTV